MAPNSMVFAVLLVGSLAVFVWGALRRASLVTLGQKDDRFDAIGTRVREMLLYAFGQKRVLAKPFGINHFVIFWSFLVLAIANTEFILHGVFSGIRLSLLPDPVYLPLILLLDLVSLLALVAVVVAMVRRLIAPPYPEARTLDAFFILSLIAILMLAFFGINAARMHGAEEGAAAQAAGWMPISSLFAGLISAASAPGVYNLAWWAHAAALLIFICYLPNSKHLHILTAIPNCFFKRLDRPNTQPREEFTAGAQFGVNSPERFTWKDLLDSFSCTECGRCQNVCPAGLTGKPLNPRGVIHELKLNLLENGPALKRGEKASKPLIGTASEGSVSEEAIWSCTTCGACMEVCPVFIEQMPKIVQLRRHLVEMEAKFPDELLNLFENIEGRSNPWGIAPGERVKWSTLMDVKPFEQGKTEYLFYVGCAGSFDSRNKHVTVALAQLLDKAGVSWGILGKDEKCCGDSLRRLGNEYAFDRLAKENVETLRQRGVKKVITQCPHCFSTLKNDYRQYGLELEVIHHSELLRDLIASGKLRINRPASDLGQTVLHDSCYLGRHNGVYEAPRQAIAAATGAAPAEMARTKDGAFCCGAGGGRMWLEEREGSRINVTRVQEALATHPQTICTACPYCMTMFEDGLKDVKAGNVRVKDIAEVVAEAVLRPAP
jgi:Fe-S oxidoreductase/nitrate reductase gamma subunit